MHVRVRWHRVQWQGDAPSQRPVQDVDDGAQAERDVLGRDHLLQWQFGLVRPKDATGSRDTQSIRGSSSAAAQEALGLEPARPVHAYLTVLEPKACPLHNAIGLPPRYHENKSNPRRGAVPPRPGNCFSCRTLRYYCLKVLFYIERALWSNTKDIYSCTHMYVFWYSKGEADMFSM